MVWKFRDFSVTQILRVTNFGGSRTSKNAVFAFLGGLNFINLENVSLLKVKKKLKNQIEPLNVGISKDFS